MGAPAVSDNHSPSSSTWRQHTLLQPPDGEVHLKTKVFILTNASLITFAPIKPNVADFKTSPSKKKCPHLRFNFIVRVSTYSPWILISRYPLTLLTRSGAGRSLLPSAAMDSCARTSSRSISFSITCLSFGENSVTSSRQAVKSCRAWAKSWGDKERLRFSLQLLSK